MRVAKALVLGMALFMIAEPASAQIGVQGGWNYSMPTVQVGGEDVSSVSNKSGFNIGIFTERGSLIGYMAGAYYSQKGFKSDTATVNLNYIEVPIMLRVAIPFVRVYGGPNFGIELDCSVDYGQVQLNGEPFFCEDNQTNTFDVGFKVGAGGKILMLSLDIAYIWGATDVWASNNGSIKNRVLQVDLGLKF